ncbi:DNA cytosine methyltransferase (plasmid) [Sphaerotilaceae bacterium SBD11-9]
MQGIKRELRHFHFCCGLGGAAKGFNKSNPRAAGLVGEWRCIGGIDVDVSAIKDFEQLAGVKGTVLDLFDRDQYEDFHGRPPPPEWREATPADIHAAAGHERPNAVICSFPCKGYSGLLSQAKSLTLKYQALNRLTLRGMWLMMEAWRDDPPELVGFENVPRCQSRGRDLLDRIIKLLAHYGYAVRETTHDCGRLGGLAQSRKRFLMVARHVEKVPPYLYEPELKPLRPVGDVLGRMPLPGAGQAGPMHRIPSLALRTWVRLAFVEAGSDWRSLRDLAVEDGKLRDYLIVPELRNGVLGVTPWDETAGVVAGRSGPTNGSFSVADPRFTQSARWSDGQAYGVHKWSDSTGTIGGQPGAGQGAFSVADPRMPPSENRHYNLFRVIKWDQHANCVTGSQQVGSGAMSIADPRCASSFEGKGKYKVTPYNSNAGTVIGGSTTGQGAFAVADPRVLDRQSGDHYLTGGHYGVVGWGQTAGAVSGAAAHDNGRWSVADPRMPAPNDKLVAIIRAMDGTWHRPFTTLELAALQSLIEPEEHLELAGLSDQAWRERIGNAIPSDAAEAIGKVFGETLLLAMAGETFRLSAQPVWVRDVAVAMSVDSPDMRGV